MNTMGPDSEKTEDRCGVVEMRAHDPLLINNQEFQHADGFLSVSSISQVSGLQTRSRKSICFDSCTADFVMDIRVGVI